MKSNFASILLVFFLSCNNVEENFIIENDNLNPEQTQKFNNWLKDFNLMQADFKLIKYDTVFKSAKKEYVKYSDTTELREYSTDSSYILLSNYNRGGIDDTLQPDMHKFEFLSKDRTKWYSGTVTMNNYPIDKAEFKILDYKWLNNNTFVFLKKGIRDNKNVYFLNKLKVGSDTIWRYNAKKTLGNNVYKK